MVKEKIKNPRKPVNLRLIYNARDHELLKKNKEEYRAYLGLKRLSWEDYFILISEEVRTGLSNLGVKNE